MKSAAVVAVCLLAAVAVVSAGYDSGASSSKRRVLVIGCDGTRGDVLHKAMFEDNLAPHFRLLAESGKFTSCEESDDPNCARAHSGPLLAPYFEWCTAPGWGSVLTGVDTDKTLIAGNDALQQVVFQYTSKQYPTFMMVAKNNGLRTAAAGSPNFISGVTPEHNPDDIGIIDYECPLMNRTLPAVRPLDTSSCNLDHRMGQSEEDDDRDKKTTAFGVQHIRDGDADVVMTHFDLIDHTGHTFNFSHNPEYLKAISTVDSQVAELLAAIEAAVSARNEEWLVLVTADHGGHGQSHGDDKVNDTCVPFIVSTHGMKNPPSLAPLKPTVRHFDVHPTVLHWLGIAPADDIDGQVQGLEGPIGYKPETQGGRLRTPARAKRTNVQLV